MSIVKFKAGRRGASGKNTAYITRESACDSISFHNLNELEAENEYEKRVNALSYAHNREEEEMEQGARSRTHYRTTLSWEGKEETEKAREMAHEFLDENFDKSRAIVAIHQDTEHTHAHIWIDARNTDERKLHSPKNHINDIARSWQGQYDREYNTNYERDFAAKREESRQYREARHKGEEAQKPERAKMSAEQFREKDKRGAGVKTNGTDKKGLGRDQRFIAEREQLSERSERGIASATGQTDRAESQARELHQEVEKLANRERDGREIDR